MKSKETSLAQVIPEKLKSYIEWELSADQMRKMFHRMTEIAMWKPRKRAEWAASAFDHCMADTLAEYADLLTQAVISRRRPINPKHTKMIMKEVLRFASERTHWCEAEDYLAVALGLDRTEMNKVSRGARKVFFDDIQSKISFWAARARKRIEFRSFISTKQSDRNRQFDPGKITISYLKRALRGRGRLEASQRKLCATLDSLNADPTRAENVPVLDTWYKKSGKRTWVGCLEHPSTHNSVKKFLSSIKPVTW